jgi:hypothetical protein
MTTESTSTADTTPMDYQMDDEDVADVDSTATRRCSRCHEQLALDCFHRGHGGYCKECRKTYYKLHLKRKRSDAPESESESEGEAGDPSDPSDPSAAPALNPNALDLYMFANSIIPDIIKIGRSKDVERRRLELQKSQPFRIITIATFPGKGPLEGAVHAALSASRVDGPGREWFRVSASDAMHAIAIAMR